ncbi:MAG: MurR/RpiR family transcriptional regulator [Erysipelotrichaceae bacterium]
MNTFRLSLINKLLKNINENHADDPNYILSEYLLKNYSKIDKINIYKIADECFVSRSSVRRFCISIGYKNFADFKKEFKQIDKKYSYFIKMHEDYDSSTEYAEWIAKQIKMVTLEVDNNIKFSDYSEIASMIDIAKNVVLLSSYSSNKTLLEFQRPLVLNNKIIDVMSDNYFNVDNLLKLKEDDLLMVISTSGYYAKSILNLTENIKATKVLITASRDKAFVNQYNKIYFLSDYDHTSEKSIVGKYGLNYFFDVLYHEYYSKYGK